jgi:phage baseplate assembly protein W
MPIPKTTQVSPLDLQRNIVIGVALPFNAPGVFNYNYSTKDQIKSNLLNLLLTNKGERIMDPNFGADIRGSLFDNITTDGLEIIRQKITTAINLYIPQITLSSVSIDSDVDRNTLNITINYILNISGTADEINIQFT